MATAHAVAPPAPSIDLAKVTETYIKIRAARADLKRDYETKDDELKGQLSKLEGFMLNHLNQHGMESVRTELGTFYRQEDIKPNITDDVAFFAWVKENDAFDALERRVKKTFVTEFMESHEGKLPPPGISVSREFVVRVRKPQ